MNNGNERLPSPQEVWIRKLAEDFGVLPDKPIYSESLQEELTQIQPHISMAVRSGVSLSEIQAIQGYENYERAVSVISSFNQVRQAKDQRAVEAEIAAFDKVENDTRESAKNLVIPEEVVKSAKDYIKFIDSDYDDFEKFKQAVTEWTNKYKSDLRYKVAFLELRGKNDEARDVRVEYIKSLNS